MLSSLCEKPTFRCLEAFCQLGEVGIELNNQPFTLMLKNCRKNISISKIERLNPIQCLKPVLLFSVKVMVSVLSGVSRKISCQEKSVSANSYRPQSHNSQALATLFERSQRRQRLSRINKIFPKMFPLRGIQVNACFAPIFDHYCIVELLHI